MPGVLGVIVLMCQILVTRKGHELGNIHECVRIGHHRMKKLLCVSQRVAVLLISSKAWSKGYPSLNPNPSTLTKLGTPAACSRMLPLRPPDRWMRLDGS